MPLTVAEVRNAKPGAKPYKVADERGLYLFVTPTGAKSWRLKYRFGGKEKVLTFGQFPEVTLAEERDQRDAARATLRADKDPAIEAERARRAAIATIGATFQASALAWHEDERPRWSERHAIVVMNALTRDVFPDLGRLPISDIDGPLILKTLRKIERRGAIETAKRVLGYLSAIFVRAKGEHLVTVNPTLDLIHALKPTPKGAKQPALTTLHELLDVQRTVDRSTSGPVKADLAVAPVVDRCRLAPIGDDGLACRHRSRRGAHRRRCSHLCRAWRQGRMAAQPQQACGST